MAETTKKTPEPEQPAKWTVDELDPKTWSTLPRERQDEVRKQMFAQLMGLQQ
jgi:hypothetical protein